MLRYSQLNTICVAVLFGFISFFLVSSMNQVTAKASPSQVATKSAHWWDFQAIDTMKLSRDKSREWLNDPEAEVYIYNHVKQIADTGATHVAIATPYDEEFLPILNVWVKAARQNNLKIWFRGNWSGWEKWFGYPAISREQHLQKTKQFILSHDYLFEDGDVFSGCPECENGGPGDPRRGDTTGYTDFLIAEYQVTKAAFDKIGKKVDSNYFSMNADVARLIMKPEATKALGGQVTIDHYVKNPHQLTTDSIAIAKMSGGDIILGEIGAPIPDIHGSMTPAQQATWLDTALQDLATVKEVKGINYWVGIGGSTKLWDDDGNALPAVATLTNYYKPKTLSGQITNTSGRPIIATIKTHLRTSVSEKNGSFVIPYLGNEQVATVSADGYHSTTVDLPPQASSSDNITIVMQKQRLSLFEQLKNVITWIFAHLSLSP